MVDAAAAWRNHDGDKVREDFLSFLAKKRKKSVPLTRIPRARTDLTLTSCEDGKHVWRMSTVYSWPPWPPVLFLLRTGAQNIDSCSNGSANQSEPQYEEENFYLTSEEGEQGRVPVLLLKPLLKHGKSSERRPVVVLLHSTGRSKETLRPYMEEFTARGYVAVAIDCRYHGERADTVDSYSNALISAWRTGEKMPFVFDTIRDLIGVVDYLSAREDVDPARIGMLGISLGGMHAWFAAVADPRIAVVVPIIGVQNFSWAVNNEMWHARVQSIPHAFEVAKEDLGKSTVDASVVAAVWQRIAPGLMDKFDAEHTIPAIAPRPLLILNGELDPRCPLKGLERIVKKVSDMYETAGFPNHFKFKVEEGVDHTFSEAMRYDASVWIDKFLKPDRPLRSAPEHQQFRPSCICPVSTKTIDPKKSETDQRS